MKVKIWAKIVDLLSDLGSDTACWWWKSGETPSTYSALAVTQLKFCLHGNTCLKVMNEGCFADADKKSGDLGLYNAI